MNIPFIINLVATVFSIAISLYLMKRWFAQENRLYTDLPLMFSLSFISMAINLFLLDLINIGLIEETLPIFKVRAFVILWCTLPMLGASLHIWMRRSQKTKIRILFLMALYWVSVIIIGPTKEFIIMFHVPILISLMLLLIVTFSITWKTERLKEIRSDLLLLSMIIITVIQFSRVSLMHAGLDFVASILDALAIIIAALALINPWYKSEVIEEQPAPVDLATI